MKKAGILILSMTLALATTISPVFADDMIPVEDAGIEAAEFSDEAWSEEETQDTEESYGTEEPEMRSVEETVEEAEEEDAKAAEAAAVEETEDVSKVTEADEAIEAAEAVEATEVIGDSEVIKGTETIEAIGIQEETQETRGTCGTNVTWQLDQNGVLTISGTGEIEDYEAFKSLSEKVTKLVVEEGVKGTIRGFGGFKKLKTAEFAGSLSQIGYFAFSSCTALENVTIHDGVQELDDGAFQHTAIKKIVLPGSLTILRNHVFQGCNALTEINIPEGCEWIQNDLFRGCASLKEITIPNTVRMIGHGTFMDCTSLKKITIPASVTSIKMNAFNGCTGLKDIYYGGTFTQWSSIEMVLYNYDDTLAGIVPHCKVQSIRNASVKLSKTSYTYNGKAKKPKVTVTLKGVELKKNRDYTVKYSRNTNAGKATVTVTGKGNFKGTASAAFNIAPKKIIPKMTLSKTVYTYNGKVRKPEVTVKYNGKKLAASKYTVTYAKGRKAVGTYKVTVKMKGNYKGQAGKAFTIRPAGTTLSSVKRDAGSLTVKWKKQSTQTGGFQVKYGTDKNFKNSRNKTVKGNKKVSMKISGVEDSKTYYVKVRAYKTVNGKTFYSKWSGVKTV